MTIKRDTNWRGRTWAWVVGVGLGLAAASGQSFCAETSSAAPVSKTLIVLALDAHAPVPLRTTFQETPPTIIITFPRQRVTGALPEHSAVGGGAIASIAARYDSRTSSQSKRFLDSIRIVLSGPYQYQVDSQAGRIVIEIQHPASIRSTSVEVGLNGGTVIGGVGQRTMNERFRAMQEALASATPTPWTLQLTSELEPGSSVASSLRRASPSINARAGATQGSAKASTAPVMSTTLVRRWTAQTRPPWPGATAWWILAIGGLIAAAGAWLLARQDVLGTFVNRQASRGANPRLASGVLLVDELVWRAFEQQGYQLVIESALTQPPLGTMRVIIKDGDKSALLFVGNGPFFEKHTVERFVQAMRHAGVERGFLVAAGSFTVPAQRMAKAHHVTLVAREQLTELLTLGARSEYFTKQLEQQHAKLEEARSTLRQYENELATLRRQRNEASWYLGEERAKSAKLELELEQAGQELRRQEADLQRWEQEAASLRKQWEESQWYLGESHARVRHLESQLSDLQGATQRAEAAERAKNEAQWYLGEAHTKREQLEQELAGLRERVEQTVSQEHALRETLAALKQELEALRAYGERRAQIRVRVDEARVELFNGSDDPVFSGSPRDLSASGIGLDTDQELPTLPSFRIRLHVPSQEPIEFSAQQVWQRSSTDTTERYHSGYQWLELSDSARARMTQLVTQLIDTAQTSSSS